jgi:hypothetical protein
MKLTRVLAVSLLSAAYFAESSGIEAIKYYTSNELSFTFLAALQAVAPEVLAITGFKSLGLVVYTLKILGIGFLVGSVYSFIDDLIFWYLPRYLFESTKFFFGAIKKFASPQTKSAAPQNPTNPSPL